jgi:phenylacetic acid degradation operon negative regulatory protein
LERLHPGLDLAGHLTSETREVLERRALAAYVEIFEGQHVAFGELRSKVRRWWNLDEVLYAGFIEQYRPALRSLAAEEITPEGAFALYVPMLTE